VLTFRSLFNLMFSNSVSGMLKFGPF
jgi:hypothetical protein